MTELEIVSNIKSLGIDMINNAGSGHPGIVLSSAPILYSLYAHHLNINPIDPTWFNRDRFVLSAGHGSALLYSVLFMCGYTISIDDLRNFRKINSKTPGHPEVGVTPGVDCSTGALGQGLGMAVGMALGEKILEERYRVASNESLIDYNVYCLVGDGDLMEGISYESASLAGTLKLNNLIVLYDSNGVTLDGNLSMSFAENVRDRFSSMGWETFLVKDGNNISDISKTIGRAKNSDKPAFIEIKTKIGNGLINEGTSKVHGGVLTKEDVSQLKNKLGMPLDSFYYNENYINYLRTNISTRVNKKYTESNVQYRDYIEKVCKGNKVLASYMFKNEFNFNLFEYDWHFENNLQEATRDSNKQFIDFLMHNIKTFVGGSADVGSTTKTYIDSLRDVTKDNYNGFNIWFGVREHAMGAILNGMALVNLKPYGSTFLSFADYLKPAMRFSSLMKLPVTYIFTHDSILIGSDGPTHQPIEQLSMLRAIPNMKVFRPADAKELLGCWQVILNSNHNPSSLILSRTEVRMHQNTDSKLSVYGGYIYYKEHEDLDYIIVATGTELTYARNIGVELINSGYNKFRIVSMPCIEQFLQCKKEYRDSVIVPGKKVIVIEAGNSFGWDRITDSKISYVTLSDFGASGSKEEVLKYMNFDYNSVKEKVFNIIKNNM